MPPSLQDIPDDVKSTRIVVGQAGGRLKEGYETGGRDLQAVASCLIMSLPYGVESTTFQDVCFVCHRQNPSCCRSSLWSSSMPTPQSQVGTPQSNSSICGCWTDMFGCDGDVAHACCLCHRHPVCCIKKHLPASHPFLSGAREGRFPMEAATERRDETRDRIEARR